MATYIQDTITNQYYAVSKDSETDENSFPYWTLDIDKAYDFGSEIAAKIEMSCIDVTFDNTRNPIIINA